MMWKIEKHKATGTHWVRVPFVAFVSLIVIIVGLTIMLWSAERGRTTHLDVKNPGDFSALLPSIVGLTQASLDGGNGLPAFHAERRAFRIFRAASRTHHDLSNSFADFIIARCMQIDFEETRMWEKRRDLYGF